MSNIYVFGDSAAQGIYLDDDGVYRISRKGCLRLLKHMGYPIINKAKHGNTIEQGLAAFSDTKTEPEDLCVIEFGGNDCDLDWDAVAREPGSFHDGRVPIAEFRKKLEGFVASARKRKMETVLVTPTPLLSERYYAWVSRGRDAGNILRYLRDDPATISRWQERYANVIRDTAAKLGCRLADLRGWMLDELDFPSLMCMDGIHPNETGHAMIAKAATREFPI